MIYCIYIVYFACIISQKYIYRTELNIFQNTGFSSFEGTGLQMQINKGNIKVLGPELSFNLFRERENRYMNGSIDMLPCCMLDGNPDVSNTEHTVSPGSSDPF